MLRTAERTRLARVGNDLSEGAGAVSRKKVRVGIFTRNRLLREYLSAAMKGHVEVTSAMVPPEYPRGKNPPEIVLVEHQDVNRTSVGEIVATVPAAKLVLLSGDVDELNVAECVRLGFVGFVLKDAGVSDLVNTIWEVAEGRSAIPAAITTRLCRQLYEERQTAGQSAIAGNGALTVRERQIVGLVVEGLTNKEIAQRLNIATYTVKSHVHNLLQKLNLRKRIDLVHYCFREGDLAA